MTNEREEQRQPRSPKQYVQYVLQLYIPVTGAISSRDNFCTHTAIKEQVQLCRSSRSDSGHVAVNVWSSLWWVGGEGEGGIGFVRCCG
jgi:hypothetical protein